MNKPSTDVIRRVFSESGREFIEVGPWPDDPLLVELRTQSGEGSAGFWGSVNVSMTPAMAKELGRALIASAEDVSSSREGLL